MELLGSAVHLFAKTAYMVAGRRPKQVLVTPINPSLHPLHPSSDLHWTKPTGILAEALAKQVRTLLVRCLSDDTILFFGVARRFKYFSEIL